MRLGGGLGLGGIAIVVVIGLLSGQDPLQILGQLANQGGPAVSQQGQRPAGDDPQVEFVRAVLGDTEDTWRALFQQNGVQYRDPTLVLFRGGVNSACGFASSAVGPFYCPGDQQVYLDLQFFDEMARRFSAAGDFAQAYVIAHEVGHHVQTLLGVSQQMQAARQRGARMEGDNGLLVRQELQAGLLCRRLGLSRPATPRLAGGRRPGRSAERRQCHRRRQPAEAQPGPRGPGCLHPRHLGAAGALVPRWLRAR